METLYRIEPGQSARVLLPAAVARRVGLAGEVTLAFGRRRASVQVATARESDADLLTVPGAAVEDLGLVTGCRYRVRAEPRQIRLGPVVGILAGRAAAQLTRDRLRTLANGFIAYRHWGGLWFAFARDGLDLARGTVWGYRYAGPGADDWEPGAFPLPQVIFRRYGVPLGPLIHPLREHGVRVFNERIFDKWEAARWLSTDPRVRPHVPETRLLRGVDTVARMLERHGCVFVKPALGAQGHKVVRVRRTADGHVVHAPGEPAVACGDGQDLATVLAPWLPRYGIVQQGLDLATHGGRLVDFRIILLKDGRGQWTVPGIAARCGARGLFVSNMAAGGFPLPAEDGLALLFGRAAPVIFRRRQELADLGLAVGEALDRSGLLLGDLGLDVAYDREDRPWVIEANNRYPDHAIAWEAGNWPLYYQARALPMAYALHLAGFAGPAAGTLEEA